MLPPFLQEFINWYFAPWLRIKRPAFNGVLLVATLPGLFLGLGSMAGFLSPMVDLMTMAQHMSGSADAASLTGMSDTLQQMKGLSSTLESGGKAVGGSNWQSWFNLIIMGSLTPLFMGRARDIGVGHKWVWVPTLLGQASLITDFLGLITIPTGLGWLTGIASFVTTLWLCLKKSKPREPKFPVDETINPPHNPNDWPPAPYA